MDRFQMMRVFTEVVKAGSFIRAASLLSLPRSSVTSAVRRLEAQVGVQLLHRTTRSLSLTPDGAVYYERCRQILEDVEALDGQFQITLNKPRGRLRIDLPGPISQALVMPALPEFHSLFPDIELRLGTGDRLVDLVEENVDCVIRTGPLADSSLIARRLGMLDWVTCAAPSYLASAPRLESLEDLAQHRAVNYFSTRTGRNADLVFQREGEEVQVPMTGDLAVNDTQSYIDGAIGGFGLIQVAEVVVRRQLASGELVEVLNPYRKKPVPISVVYPQARHLSPTVRVFVDWVVEVFAVALRRREESAGGR
ncbi:MAG: LysR family transcriptional regulator [Caulobacter sp.]|nr:LysR family transcriptional regulator [Caulobacter sp.]